MDKHRVIWEPSEILKSASQMAEFMRQAGVEQGRAFVDYADLWQWSVDDPAGFWAAVWRYVGVIAGRGWDEVLRGGDQMPGARWFPGARLNFAENLLRYRDYRRAVLFRDEAGGETALSYAELHDRTARLAAAFHALGIGPGDRVAAITPNIPEALIGMLATTWLGAVWSSCSPDFGVAGILDRFSQIEPKLLIAADGYRFKGRLIDIRDKVEKVRAGLPNCKHCLFIPWQGTGELEASLRWDAALDNESPPPPFARLPFDHPLYILFSSGTTGKPKCIVHSAGGTLLQHLKEHRLHTDIRREDRLFYFTTCGWMMWNWLVSGLASGAALVLFDGNPLHPTADALWRMADDLGVTVFGASAKYLSAQEKAGVRVVERLGLHGLRTVLSTGSPLAPESCDYVNRDIKPGVQISSISGGTDIVSCFALGNPLLPVRRGQLQCRGLGMAVDVFDPQGRSLRDLPGEMVCTKPFPSMPVGFWNDPQGSRYQAAYFMRFPGVWTHGDWTVLTAEGGLIIEGRSDAVLNPGGVRIGTAEIYRQVEHLAQVEEAVCVGQRWEGDVRLVLFVILRDGKILDDGLRNAIRRILRENASPRHVPAKILQVTDIPRTRSGKISELAVRDTLEGRPVANTEALLNPQALAQYRDRPELARS
ncbi:MAG: acetoacetate--CoA ligase [Candidatus Thiodiazotropha sp. (ex Epidulcina cf. delphinae)]|nr:acetoacetate--CoA ligase [Candidatus Thiodiazotropha sp. (ex Epidulcina cf. delphinae)]